MPIKKPNIPESFNVLIKELQAIGLDVSLLDKEELSDSESQTRTRYEKIIELEKSIPAWTTIEQTKGILWLADDEEDEETADEE
jgi:DNA-directed RNA polymerase subunit beta